MMHLKELVRVVHGALRIPESADPALPGIVESVSTDTRSLRPGAVYFALRGPNFDGHDYVAEAFRRGAVAAVVRRDVEAPGPVIRVENVLSALGNLAAVFRMMLGSRVVAVTGSNGKTTTKEMIAHLLSQRYDVVRARESWNNFIGVPLTLFEAKPGTDFIVIEAGTNRKGEIGRLGSIARPDAAVITSVSEAHLEGLESLEGVAEEKASLLQTLRGSGFGVIPDNAEALNPFVRLSRDKIRIVGFGPSSDLRAEEVAHGFDGTVFRVGTQPFRLGLLGAWNVRNALSAIAVATAFGLTLEECSEALAAFRPPKMRMELLKVRGLDVLNDAYNSNPASAEGAISEFDALPASGRKVVVFGDMLELGVSASRWHERLGQFIAQRQGIDLVVGVGRESRAVVWRTGGLLFQDVGEACARVREFLKPGDTVLLKGSRGMKLENLIKAIHEAFALEEVKG